MSYSISSFMQHNIRMGMIHVYADLKHKIKIYSM